MPGSCTPSNYSHSKWYGKENNVWSTMENKGETLINNAAGVESGCLSLNLNREDERHTRGEQRAL